MRCLLLFMGGLLALQMSDYLRASMPHTHAERMRLRIHMRHDAFIERALRDADACAGVSHRTSGQAERLQEAQSGNACIRLAHTCIVEHAEQGP